MRKIMHWMLTAILCICGASIFTSCSNDNSDNPAPARGRLDLHRHVPDGESGMMAD